MKKIFFSILLVFAFTSIFCESRFELDNRIRDAIVLIEQTQNSPERAVPQGVMDKCYGIAIFPSVIKGGIVFGAMYGEGVMISKFPNSNRWGAPVFMTLKGASFGLQAGAASLDMILVIMNRHGVESLSHTNITLGGDIGVAAGPAGRNAAIEGGLTTAILSYSNSKGLFAGVALKGAIIGPDHKKNKTMYGPNVTVSQILAGDVETSEAADMLMRELRKY